MYLKFESSYIKILICIILHLITAASHDKVLRIIGGRDATPGEFPYVLKIELKVETESGDVLYKHFCTCSLLKPTWSLTAGHCVAALLQIMSQSPLIKGFIKYSLSSDREYAYSKILSTYLHPNLYISHISARNDIGLLFTEKIAVNTFVKLSPVDYLTLYGAKVLSLGYGITKDSNGSFGDAHSVNKSLQVLDAIITRCFKSSIYPSFCLGGLCNQLSVLCPGDSGGPVLHESGLVGVNTGNYFKNCDEKLFLTFFSRLKSFGGLITPGSPYIDWIVKVIK